MSSEFSGTHKLLDPASLLAIAIKLAAWELFMHNNKIALHNLILDGRPYMSGVCEKAHGSKKARKRISVKCGWSFLRQLAYVLEWCNGYDLMDWWWNWRTPTHYRPKLCYCSTNLFAHIIQKEAAKRYANKDILNALRGVGGAKGSTCLEEAGGKHVTRKDIWNAAAKCPRPEERNLRQGTSFETDIAQAQELLASSR